MTYFPMGESHPEFLVESTGEEWTVARDPGGGSALQISVGGEIPRHFVIRKIPLRSAICGEELRLALAKIVSEYEQAALSQYEENCWADFTPDIEGIKALLAKCEQKP